MKIHSFRLKPGHDVRKEIESYVTKHKINAGIVLTCVGNLAKAEIRLANENIIKTYEQKWGFEIV